MGRPHGQQTGSDRTTIDPGIGAGIGAAIGATTSGVPTDGAPDTVVVVLGGGPVIRPDGPERIGPERIGPERIGLVIAADSGFDEATRVGLAPDLIIGDLDSISASGLAAARAAGIEMDMHPRDKDHTDAALAFDRAAAGGWAHLVVLASGAIDRLDHLLGTIAALGHPGLAVFDTITAYVGATTVRVLHPGHRVSFDLAAGRVFSLVAAHGPCSTVHLVGARWPLDGTDLGSASTRGISNEAARDSGPIDVRVGDGVLTVVVPPASDPRPSPPDLGLTSPDPALSSHDSSQDGKDSR